MHILLRASMPSLPWPSRFSLANVRTAPLWLLTLSSACSSSSPTIEERPPGPSATVVGSSSPSSPPVGAGARREGAPGSTKGTVSCGEARCRVPAETCVYDQSTARYKCVASAYDPKVKGSKAIGHVCDDGSDCPDGTTCCRRRSAFVSSLDETTACVPRADVLDECASEVCAPGGALCPPDESCLETTPGEGTCEPQKGPATCANREPCPADKPICAIGNAGPVCVAKGSPEWVATPGGSRYECTLQSDCHGDEMCSFSVGEAEPDIATYCSEYDPGSIGTIVCDPEGPSLCGSDDAQCEKEKICDARWPALPWLGAWTSR